VLDSLNPESRSKIHREPAPIFPQRLVDRCHVILPDMVQPIGAIVFEGQYYAYVKFFSTVESAQRAAERLMEKGNAVIITRIPKGLVLWVHEPEAEPATKS
jgi:hypothetical protein